MEKVKKILVALCGILLFFIVLGGIICAQVILWKTAWYIAVMHLVLVVFAINPVIATFRWILKYIS